MGRRFQPNVHLSQYAVGINNILGSFTSYLQHCSVILETSFNLNKFFPDLVLKLKTEVEVTFWERFSLCESNSHLLWS